VGLIVVDASVVIAFRDEEDPHHAMADAALTEAGDKNHLVLPASAFAESIVRPLAGGVPDEQVTADLLRAFTIEPLTHPIALAAAKLRVSTKLRLPDALVVATGIALDADKILTCDKAWEKVNRRVKVLGMPKR
jgi:predicted nucleic acid-binding protein